MTDQSPLFLDFKKILLTQKGLIFCGQEKGIPGRDIFTK
jgi:hypothetical protein